jgi:hypothetical protein
MIYEESARRTTENQRVTRLKQQVCSSWVWSILFESKWDILNVSIQIGSLKNFQ